MFKCCPKPLYNIRCRCLNLRFLWNSGDFSLLTYLGEDEYLKYEWRRVPEKNVSTFSWKTSWQSRVCSEVLEHFVMHKLLSFFN